MKVSELISRPPISVEIDDSIKEASKIMSKENVGSVVVTDEGKIAGIVTERDIIRAIADETDLNMPVSVIMSKNLVTINGDQDVSEAAALMMQKGIRHLIVVDSNGSLLGVVSIRDVLKALGKLVLDLTVW
ncbi:MAG: CBS domain-containing protein [Sulfolobaceae archaeon]|nr:CBS domain-containing protein [Sulfolobaceae archaeon]